MIPSISNRFFWYSLSSVDFNAKTPLELITRCQGKLYFFDDECKSHETCRAALGFPANLEMNP